MSRSHTRDTHPSPGSRQQLVSRSLPGHMYWQARQNEQQRAAVVGQAASWFTDPDRWTHTQSTGGALADNRPAVLAIAGPEPASAPAVWNQSKGSARSYPKSILRTRHKTFTGPVRGRINSADAIATTTPVVTNRPMVRASTAPSIPGTLLHPQLPNASTRSGRRLSDAAGADAPVWSYVSDPEVGVSLPPAPSRLLPLNPCSSAAPRASDTVSKPTPQTVRARAIQEIREKARQSSRYMSALAAAARMQRASVSRTAPRAKSEELDNKSPITPGETEARHHLQRLQAVGVATLPRKPRSLSRPRRGTGTRVRRTDRSRRASRRRRARSRSCTSPSSRSSRSSRSPASRISGRARVSSADTSGSTDRQPKPPSSSARLARLPHAVSRGVRQTSDTEDKLRHSLHQTGLRMTSPNTDRPTPPGALTAKAPLAKSASIASVASARAVQLVPQAVP